MKRLLFIAALSLIVASPAFSAGGLGDMKLDSKIESMKKAKVGAVVFPHTAHEKLFKCDACHPKIFKDKKGTNDISMKKNMEQKFCGSPSCHNSTEAFPLYMCAKCHTNAGAAKK